MNLLCLVFGHNKHPIFTEIQKPDKITGWKCERCTDFELYEWAN